MYTSLGYVTAWEQPVSQTRIHPKVLLDTYLCQQEKLYGDRPYRLLGYKSTATIPVPDSFSADMDAFSAFLIQGITLSGKRRAIHEGVAIEFYNTR